ncbi:Hypothetical predicted protein [Paramuricea clavata]|uniref:Uncharacterized protein n=1 Tax=Paramuricea clavata TaxID=317549 RepID=A0A6S7FQD3_PARCT|nr:Hypothetical predicted protein [Paramuricea clavata]
MKRTREQVDDEPVEVHDSGFMGPMVMFPTFPHNDTFVDSRKFKLMAGPIANPDAEEFTFKHAPNDFGVMDLKSARITANITITTATNVFLALTQDVALNQSPLRLGWKSREVLVNNQRINSLSSQENEIELINHLTRETPLFYKADEDITGCIHNTPGAANVSDSIAEMRDPTNAAHVNKGLGKRYQLCKRAVPFRCYDFINVMGDNKRYVVSSFEMTIRLTRLEKTKTLMGNAAHCALAKIRYNDMQIHIQAFKPKAQLMAAINTAMVQKGEEAKYYVRHFRYVPIAVANGTQKIYKNDLFTGARPTRMFIYIRTQDRYNGAHTLNPNRIIFPDIEFVGVKINEAFIEPTIENSKEAYINLRKILNRTYDDMPFNYKDYLTDYGFIAFDLSENKDSYNQILPNATSGVVSLEIRLNNGLAVASQLIVVGEFRNQLSCSYQTEARLKFAF